MKKKLIALTMAGLMCLSSIPGYAMDFGDGGNVLEDEIESLQQNTLDFTLGVAADEIISMEDEQDTLLLSEEDIMEYYTVTDNIIEFDTSAGPFYKIDYVNKTILDCSSDGAVLIDCNVDGTTLKLTVYSDERLQNTTYTFDLTKNKVQNDDALEYYTVYNDNVIEFDTASGPLYDIDYVEKKILNCSSDELYPESAKAVLLECYVVNNLLTVTVYSAEKPQNTTYTYDLTQNKVDEAYYKNDLSTMTPLNSSRYKAIYNNGVVTFTNNNNSESFSVTSGLKFYSLFDGYTFNIVFDNTGKIYINEYTGNFVVSSITTQIEKNSFLFTFYDSEGNDIQEEATDYCAGTTPYGCVLANISDGIKMKDCFHGSSPIPSEWLNGLQTGTLTITPTPTVTPIAMATSTPTPMAMPTPTPTSTPIPSPTPTTRAAIVRTLSECTVTGLENALQFWPGIYYDFTATGIGPDSTQSKSPVEGDTYYTPVYWSMYTSPSSPQRNNLWKIGSAAGISEANTYKMYVFFRKMVYTGGKWTSAGDEYKEVSFSSAAITILSVNGTTKFAKTYGDSAFTLDIKKSGNGSMQYASSKISVAAVNSKGKVTIKGIGTAYITIFAKGPSSDQKSNVLKVTITVKPKGTSFSSLTASSKAFTAKWKKQETQTTGYQIQYSANSKFTSAKTVTVKNTSTVSKKVSNLSSKKKYYVRVRTYKTVSGKNYFSSWSKAKAVTTK